MEAGNGARAWESSSMFPFVFLQRDRDTHRDVLVYVQADWGPGDGAHAWQSVQNTSIPIAHKVLTGTSLYICRLIGGLVTVLVLGREGGINRNLCPAFDSTFRRRPQKPLRCWRGLRRYTTAISCARVGNQCIE